MLLNRVKVLLGITNNDNEELLREIIEITEAKILNYINSSELPRQLEFVLVELSIKRFNRIGSEGFTSETVDGKTMSYEESEFEGYEKYLDDYICKNNINKGGKLLNQLPILIQVAMEVECQELLKKIYIEKWYWLCPIELFYRA